MPARLLTGTERAEEILESLRDGVQRLDPKLTIVLVGENAESEAYIERKLKACEKIGMRTELKRLPATITLEALLAEIETLNADDDVSGVIVQSPLPPALQPNYPLVMRALEPKKDVDGFTAYNLGKVVLSTEYEHLPPATAAGVIELLTHYDIAIEGKHAVVIGRSAIVGKPLAAMLLNRSATVTVCHSKTADLAAHTKTADILIAAVGSPGLVTADIVKPGAVVIDVGITRHDGKLVGDVAEGVRDIAGAVSPVPGGVGPLMVACLLRNCVRAKERQRA